MSFPGRLASSLEHDHFHYKDQQDCKGSILTSSCHSLCVLPIPHKRFHWSTISYVHFFNHHVNTFAFCKLKEWSWRLSKLKNRCDVDWQQVRAGSTHKWCCTTGHKQTKYCTAQWLALFPLATACISQPEDAIRAWLCMLVTAILPSSAHGNWIIIVAGGALMASKKLRSWGPCELRRNACDAIKKGKRNGEKCLQPRFSSLIWSAFIRWLLLVHLQVTKLRVLETLINC